MCMSDCTLLYLNVADFNEVVPPFAISNLTQSMVYLDAQKLYDKIKRYSQKMKSRNQAIILNTNLKSEKTSGTRGSRLAQKLDKIRPWLKGG